MSSISNVNNTSIPMSRQNINKTDLTKQNLNVEPSFSHVVMPESSSLSNRTVEQLPSQSSSIPLSVPAFGDSRISQEEEKTFTPARPVFFDDDLELPSVMPTMVETALPEVYPTVTRVDAVMKTVLIENNKISGYYLIDSDLPSENVRRYEVGERYPESTRIIAVPKNQLSGQKGQWSMIGRSVGNKKYFLFKSISTGRYLFDGGKPYEETTREGYETKRYKRWGLPSQILGTFIEEPWTDTGENDRGRWEILALNDGIVRLENVKTRRWILNTCENPCSDDKYSRVVGTDTDYYAKARWYIRDVND